MKANRRISNKEPQKDEGGKPEIKVSLTDQLILEIKRQLLPPWTFAVRYSAVQDRETIRCVGMAPRWLFWNSTLIGVIVNG